MKGRKKLTLKDTKFSGIHNGLNILSALIATNEMGICSKKAIASLANIRTLPHRLEEVTIIDGVRFIDDSKSTSCQSLKAALQSFGKQSVILIAGGSDKWDTFDGLEDVLREKTVFCVFIGATREILALIAKKADIAYVFAENMDEAVDLAYTKSKKEQVVLLSPGCASFGLFRDYLDRAEKFRNAIKKLA